jgi:hypothetical protein
MEKSWAHVEAMSVIPATAGSVTRKIMIQAGVGKK